jgi:hypothetical protein
MGLGRPSQRPLARYQRGPDISSKCYSTHQDETQKPPPDHPSSSIVLPARGHRSRGSDHIIPHCSPEVKPPWCAPPGRSGEGHEWHTAIARVLVDRGIRGPRDARSSRQTVPRQEFWGPLTGGGRGASRSGVVRWCAPDQSPRTWGWASQQRTGARSLRPPRVSRSSSAGTCLCAPPEEPLAEENGGGTMLCSICARFFYLRRFRTGSGYVKFQLLRQK